MPLIIRGARQVVKSTLVHLFCQSNNIDLIEINLEREKLISKAVKISLDIYSKKNISHKINNENISSELISIPGFAIEESFLKRVSVSLLSPKRFQDRLLTEGVT